MILVIMTYNRTSDKSLDNVINRNFNEILHFKSQNFKPFWFRKDWKNFHHLHLVLHPKPTKKKVAFSSNKTPFLGKTDCILERRSDTRERERERNEMKTE